MGAKLFEPIQLGAIHAKNRIFMAPLTRARATAEGVPTSIMADYYSQRAGAGLIFTEATGISQEGLGWPYAPGIWSREQVQGWKNVTKAVHANNGKIVLQLWHMGYTSHSSVIKMQPVGPSPGRTPDKVYTWEGKTDSEEARELTKEDIERITGDFVTGAKNAIEAGFDGVQIQAANGYLIDEFLRDSTNKRTDEYGGSIENRVRFMDEVVGAVVEAVGAEKTSVRLSPNGEIQGVIDSDPEALFTEAAKKLQARNVAFIEMRESGPDATFSVTDQLPVHDAIRRVFKNPIVLGQDYDLQKAIAEVDSGVADAITFGRMFISNPDLVERYKNDWPLAMPDWALLYTQDAKGYSDFPPYQG